MVLEVQEAVVAVHTCPNEGGRHLLQLSATSCCAAGARAPPLVHC